MSLMRCEGCGADLRIPQQATAEARAEIGTIRRDTGIPLTMRQFFRLAEGSLTLGECKDLALHITVQKKVCHKCKADLPDLPEPPGAGLSSLCPNCREMNLDW